MFFNKALVTKPAIEPDATMYVGDNFKKEVYLWKRPTPDAYSSKHFKAIDVNQNPYFCVTINKPEFLTPEWESFWQPGTEKLKLYNELSIVGGNIWRELGGKNYPKYYSGLTKFKDNLYPCRISEYRNFYRIAKDKECSYLFFPNTNSVLLDNLFTFSGKIPSGNRKPYFGIISGWVFSFLLGDNDIENLGFIEEETYYRTVRFDPEICFNPSTWFHDKEIIAYALRCLADYKESFKENDEEAYKEVPFKVQAFFDDINEDKWNKTFWAWHDDLQPEQEEAFGDIYYSIWRQFEVYAALSRIVDFSYQIDRILNNVHLSPEFIEQEKILKSELKKYFQTFSECAFTLDSFSEFYTAYNTPGTDIYKFCKELFGEHLSPPLPSGYVCYTPNYQDTKDQPKETPTEFLNRTNAQGAEIIKNEIESKGFSTSFFQELRPIDNIDEEPEKTNSSFNMQRTI